MLRAVLLASLALLAWAETSRAQSDEIAHLGTRRELFVDRHLIDSLDGLRLELSDPVDAGVAFAFDRPWESAFSAYVTVIHDGGSYRAYYRGLPEPRLAGDAAEVTCVAESDDGIHWRKPSLGLFEVAGTRENNVILAGAAPATHNFAPFVDRRPGVPKEERYKALAGKAPEGLSAFVSGDGIRWRRLRDEPVFTAEGWVFDSQNVSFWSETERRYLLYYRSAPDDIRAIARTTSEDFLDWSAPVQMRYGDTGTTRPRHHLYTNQTHPYFRAPHILLATAARYLPGRQVLTEREAQEIGVHSGYFGDTSDAVLLTSRGGDLYDQELGGALIAPGIGAQNWVSRSNYPALNVVPTGPHEMSLYVNQSYGQPSAHLRRYRFRTDGLAALRGDTRGGELLTRPLTFSGRRLFLNFLTSAAGSVRIEIQDAAGRPIPGYSLEECLETIGNEIEREVRWQHGADVGALAGRVVRLRFAMREARLYSFRFGSTPDAEREARLLQADRISGDAPHSAFTDLARYRGRWFAAFREGESHVSDDGAARIVVSDDGRKWRPSARIASQLGDVRDPKLSVTPEGRLMLLAAIAVQPPGEVRHRSFAWFSDDGEHWDSGREIGEPNFWLWRVSWHDGVGWGVGYETGAGEGRVRLYRSEDGRDWEVWVPTLFTEGRPSEAQIAFAADGTAYCLLRRDGTPSSAMLGRASPPYRDWTWADLGVRLGGPALARLSDGRWIVAGRRYEHGARTVLHWLDPARGELTDFLTLPSSGDTSYPGLVEHEGEVWLSYYSSHEERTAAYVARVAVPRSELLVEALHLLGGELPARTVACRPGLRRGMCHRTQLVLR